MKVANNYQEVFEVGSSMVETLVSKLSNCDWDNWKHRQQLFKEMNSTKTYPLSWVVNGSSSDNFQVDIKNKYDTIWNEVSVIVKQLEKQFDGKHLNILFAHLPAHQKIDVHKDQTYILNTCHRFHLPLKTNSNVVFYINEMPFYLKKGMIYEIDNTGLHGVYNNSDEDRIHLIIDIFPNSCSKSISYIMGD